MLLSKLLKTFIHPYTATILSLLLLMLLLLLLVVVVVVVVSTFYISPLSEQATLDKSAKYIHFHLNT